MAIFRRCAVVASGIVGGLVLLSGLSGLQAREPQMMAQADGSGTSTTEAVCVPLQEVTTGQTEVRKRIENRLLTQGNWNTDFLVPAGNDFSYFVAVVTPENNASYELTVNLRLPQGGSEMAISRSAEVEAGTTYSIPFQSPTGRQPAVINARVGGVNGNFYTLSVAACE